MTIATSTGRIQYSGNGVTDDFATNFKLLDESHVEVTLTSSAGVDTVQTISTHYTVALGASTATVTMLTPPASGETLTLRLLVPITQTYDLVNGQAFNADTIETALDLGTQVDQSLQEQIDRCVKLDVSDDVADLAALLNDVQTVADIETDVNTVAGISANVTTVAGISSDVTTVATNVADITNFSDVYIGAAASDPSTRSDASALQEGDLYFNTTTDVLKFYTGSTWEALNNIPGTGTVTSIAMGEAMSLQFDTKADAVAATIPSDIDSIEIRGYTSTGDGGGAKYKRVGSEPSHDGKFQTADTAWWALAESTLNFLMFGADSTGVSDASTEIQSCVDAADSLNAEIYNHTGTYLIATPIELPSNTVLKASTNVTYKNNVTSAYPMFLNGTYGGTYTARSANTNIKMIGGNVDADSKNTTCIAFAQGKDFLIKDMFFSNLIEAHFIEINSSINARIEGCTFRDMSESGTRSFSEAINIDFFSNTAQFPHFNAASADGTVCENIDVIGNYFEDCLVSIGAHSYTAYGDSTTATMSKNILIKGNTHVNSGSGATGAEANTIHIDGFWNTVIEGETASGGAVNFVRIDESINYTVSNCTVEGYTTGNMVFLGGSASVPVQNGSITGNTARNVLDVVYVYQADRTNITGNTGENIRNGVQATLSDDLTISGNTFNDCSRSGVYAYTTCNRFTIVGNTIRDTTEAVVDLNVALFTLGSNTLSLPASSKDLVRLNACTNGMVANNIGNGASIAAAFYITGSTTDTSLMGNQFGGTGTNSILIDSGCDDILYDQNRFLGSFTLTDNGANSVVGTNWTT